jgi:LacI family transcriptional regulator
MSFCKKFDNVHFSDTFHGTIHNLYRGTLVATGIKDIARKLNLGSSTVAYALSGKGTIGEATRQRVLRAAAEIGYTPNKLAARMRSKRTNVIGLVIPDVVLAYNELIQQIFRNAVSAQYEVQIALTEFREDLEDRAIRSLLESRVDGIILKTHYPSLGQAPKGHALRQLHEQRIPTVVYGHRLGGTGLAAYELPARRIAELLCQHLLELGHRRFAWLFPVEPPLVALHQQRIDGSSAVLADWGLDPMEAMSVLVLRPNDAFPDMSPAQSAPPRPGDRYDNYINQNLPRVGVRLGRILMRRAMSEGTAHPTAVLCLNEITAIGAILEAQAMGLAVPGDVAVVAAARTIAAELAPMTLTTADVSCVDAAGKMLELLFDLIEQRPGRANTVTSEPMLQVGRSSAGEAAEGMA